MTAIDDRDDVRAGTGYDIHRTVGGRPLILGGVRLDATFGLDGHSDADALTHAVIDALLGAGALGDIGTHFPPSDARYAGADSIELLRATLALVRERGLGPWSLDCTVVCEHPKLAPHMARMRERLAGALEIPIERVSVKAKTNEGLDAVGRGEAIAAHAIMIVRRASAP